MWPERNIDKENKRRVKYVNRDGEVEREERGR